MSYLCRRFRGICTIASLQTARKPQTELRYHHRPFVYQLFDNPDLRWVVDNFKESSKFFWFRKLSNAYTVTVRRLAAAKKFSWIEEILEEQRKYKGIEFEGFVVRIMCLYGEVGMSGHAQNLFDEMPQLNCRRTVRSFNALLGAYLHSKKFDQVERIFREVPPKLSINVNVVSYNTVLKALCEMGSLDASLLLIVEMERTGVEPDHITYSTILGGLYMNGRFSDVEEIWRLVENKGIVLSLANYYDRLKGLVSQKRMSEAVKLFSGLKHKGIKPDARAFNALLKGFCDGGHLEEVKRWYMELTKNISPNRNTFALLVPFACEVGDFGLGFRLCQEAIMGRFILDAGTLQRLFDGLVNKSMPEEAKKLVELIQQSDVYSSRELKWPLGE